MPNINSGSQGLPRSLILEDHNYLKIQAAGANTGSAGVSRLEAEDLERTVQDAHLGLSSGVYRKPEAHNYSASSE